MPRKPANPTRDIPRGAGWLSAAIEVTAGHWKCQARWKDGVRYRAKSFHGPTRQAVLDAGSDYLRIVSRQKRDGRTVAAIDMTVEDAVTQWLERRASSWKDATYATYRQRARRLVLPHIGLFRVTDLDAPRIQAWIDSLHRSGAAGNTIASASMVLSGAMKELVRLGVLPSNPAAGVRLPTSGVTPHETWDTSEIQAVLGYVAREPLWNAVYRLALFTGLRPGELQALKWPDVDLDAGTITPQVTMTKDRQGRVVVGTTTKTGRPRVITIPASVVSALRVWRTRQKEQRIAAVTWDSRTFVFTTRTGRYLAQSSWQ
ncbi:MAG: site-specific integrase, partial [Chloroflexota bacterium]|nr:site-specific integrase [Chloroflexota bacterium]